MENFSLRNKLILVSGATSGIGFEICKQIFFAGGNFIGIGRNIKELRKFIEINQIFDSKVITVDLSQESQTLDAIKIIDKIDGFVHCAGIVKNNPIQFFNKDLYNQIRAINLDSSLIILSQLLKQKKLNKPSSVIFMSSISGIFGMKGNGLYAITKSSLNIMAKTYANELSGKRIRVNAIAPGMVNTKISQDANDFLSQEVIELDKKKYPLGYGEPEDVALPVIFLLSEASKWITGQVIVLDGGRTAII
jgi:NAD(P)-dependent dehydrogenase (short-subunit alcohol dehydrogenase family)